MGAQGAIFLLIVLVGIAQCKARTEKPNPWPAPIKCYLYPFLCGTCAAADVNEFVAPGTWWRAFCWLQFLGHCVPVFGSCLQMRFIFATREALALKMGLAEEPVGRCPHTCCEGLACQSCYLGQELASLQTAQAPSAASGADKLYAVA